MEGEQIPKATMNNFIKARLNVSFSAEFSNKFLGLAKDYINRLTEEANQICTKNEKKTINAEHIESALQNFGLQDQLNELKDVSLSIKEQNQMKQQFRQRIQENIEKNLQQIEGQENEPRVVSIKDNINMIEIHQDQVSDQIDYEAEMQEQNGNNSEPSGNSNDEEKEEPKEKRSSRKKGTQ